MERIVVRHDDNDSRLIVRQTDHRYVIDLAANIVVDDRAPIAARLTNLSRHGYRVAIAQSFPAGQPLRLEIEGWPRLTGRVVWCQGGRAGCLFDEPPVPKVYALMCASTLAQDREDF